MSCPHYIQTGLACKERGDEIREKKMKKENEKREKEDCKKTVKNGKNKNGRIDKRKRSTYNGNSEKGKKGV